MDDWDSVTVIRKKAPTAKDARNESTLNQARRAGAIVATDKKFSAAANRNHATDLNAAKLDRETEELVHKTVGMDVAKAIIKGRQEKAWTQKDLAVKINEKPQVVGEYESGKAIPNQQILTKMERNLGIKLRGKDVGQPLPARGAAKK